MGEEDCPGGLAVEELVEREVAGRGLAREVGEGGADLDLEVLRAGHRHRRLRRGRLLSGLARAVYVAQVRLSRGQLLHLEVAELLLGLLGRDGWGDDDALLGFPVARRRHLEVLREEQRLHDAHDLQEVTTGGCWVEDRGAVGLVRADEEQRAGGHGDARGVFLARVEHAQHRRDLPPLVRNQGEAQVVPAHPEGVLNLFQHRGEEAVVAVFEGEHVLRPLSVLGDRVAAQTNELDAHLGKLAGQAAADGELRRADRREVLRVREEDRPGRGPLPAEELVEPELPLRRLAVEVRKGRPNLDAEAVRLLLRRHLVLPQDRRRRLRVLLLRGRCLAAVAAHGPDLT
mmetsp:Transcript_5999/g.19206  ORF Transcript_5999/g.19206 Transcript_5999/m.19206 type:complete len:344 (+) Transcript_5999:1188-2219(+)